MLGVATSGGSSAVTLAASTFVAASLAFSSLTRFRVRRPGGGLGPYSHSRLPRRQGVQGSPSWGHLTLRWRQTRHPRRLRVYFCLRFALRCVKRVSSWSGLGAAPQDPVLEVAAEAEAEAKNEAEVEAGADGGADAEANAGVVPEADTDAEDDACRAGVCWSSRPAVRGEDRCVKNAKIEEGAVAMGVVGRSGDVFPSGEGGV